MMAQTIILESIAIKERILITIEFAPNVHRDETEYTYPHPQFVFGDRVTIGGTNFNYPPVIFTVCALELIESKTPSGKLLNQPRWKYKVINSEVSFWKEESALIRYSNPQLPGLLRKKEALIRHFILVFTAYTFIIYQQLMGGLRKRYANKSLTTFAETLEAFLTGVSYKRSSI